MSAQLKSFEGPDVQLLLDGIRQELGPGAKIERAERIRVGGVLGFFAKEHYRVIVEVPGTAEADTGDTASPAAEGPTTAPSPPSLADDDVFRAMAEATDDVNDVGAPVVTSPAVAPPAAVAPPLMAASAGPTTAIPTPGPVADAADASAAESFDAVLTRVATTLGSPPDGRPAPGSPAGHGAHPPTAEPPSADDDLPPADVAAGAAMFLAENGPDAIDTSSVDPPTWPVTPAAGPPDDTMTPALSRVGLGPSLVARVKEGLRRGAGLETLLFEIFTDLAVAPPLPRRPGSLLVVVGDGVAARRLGCALAAEIGADPAEVPFASRGANAHVVATGPLLVRSAEEAAERAPGWRRSRAAVVVVDAGVNGSERSWATHLIAALRPTGVWGVVEATAKIEDVSAWAEDLGGLDALALENLEATVSPVAALATGLPVARIDGQPTTAARWVATVVDRIIPCR